METTAHKTANRAAPVLQPASAHPQAQPTVMPSRGSLRVQRATKVSSPSDPAEKEADSTAQQVMRMAISDSAVAYTKTPRGGVFRQINRTPKAAVQTKLHRATSPYIARFANATLAKQTPLEDDTVQRQAEPEERVQKQASPEEKVQRQATPEDDAVQRQTAPEESVQKQTAPEDEVKRQTEPEETIQRQAEPEADIQRQIEPEPNTIQKQVEEPEQVQTKLTSPYMARFAQTGLFKQAVPEEETVQRQAASEEPERVQKQATEDPEQVQAKLTSPYMARFAQTGLLKQAAPEEETVKRQPDPEKDVQRQVDPEEDTVQRQAAPEEDIQRQVATAAPDTVHPQGEQQEDDTVQRKVGDQPNLAENVAADIKSSMATGSPLPLSVRRFMEPRFRADFSGVKIHTDDNAAKLNNRVSAQAFAMGNHIFFGKDKFQPDTEDGKELIAHELTHTIQQGGAEQGDSPTSSDAGEQNDSVQRREAVSVTQQSSPQVQRLGISDALDYFADRAYNIPGFRMFTIVIGVNPINMSPADRSAANILRAIVEFIPGGNLITRALDTYGIFDRAGAWIEQQIDSLGITGRSIRSAVMEFLDSLGWSDIFDLSGVWRRAQRIFTDPINRIIRFVRGLASTILQFIRDAILRPLASLAEGTRGWNLLRAILGYDPITGDPYPRNADTLIGGFMTLIGQEDVWNNIKKANAVARAWAWFQGALAGLLGFVQQIPGRFMQLLQSLTIQDLILIPRAFAKVGRAFGGFVLRFISWAGRQVMSLLQIIFEVVAPGLMPYIRRTAGAFSTIIRNPVGFLRNLVRAGVKGFRQFGRNFLRHLRTSLVSWLTGAMSGANLYIPQAFNPREILKFVLSVMGITWQNIRQKLVRVIGERAVAALETGFALVRTLITEGPAAAWEQMLEGLSNLREMVIGQIMSFVQVRIVQAAITRLVTSLNPAGAFIQAILATYNTVMFFVERLRQIAQVARRVIDAIVAIANGVIQPAANRVEQTMAGMLTLVISFLARMVGLGRVSDAVTRIINRIRQPIDRALDRVVAWIVRQARQIIQRLRGRSQGTSGQGAVDEKEKRRVAGIARQRMRTAMSRRIPANRIVADLNNLKIQYRWINRFEIRNLRNGFAIHMIASDQKLGDVIPHTTDTQRPIIDEYVQWLASYRTAINEILAMWEREEKKGRIHQAATRQYRAPRQHLDRIETQVISGSDENLMELIQSLFDERVKLDRDAEAARNNQPSLSNTGTTLSHDGRPLEAVSRAQTLAGKNVSQVRSALGNPNDEQHSAKDGRHWLLWKFRDRSSIRLDIPGLGNKSKFQVNREPHLAVEGPRGETLSRHGIVVPALSEPAHHRVF